MAAKHVFREFTATTFDETNKAWREQLEKNAESLFPNEILRVLDWAATRISYDTKAADCAYGVFLDGEHVASAIVEIVYHRKTAASMWVKMLDITLSPELDLSITDENQVIEAIARLFGVFGAAVVGSYKLTNNKATKVVKLYGRNPPLLAFLKAFGADISKDARLKNLEVTLDGRWLVFKQSTVKK